MRYPESMKKLLFFFSILSTLLFSQLKELDVKPVENRGGIPIFRDYPDKAGIIFYTQFDNLKFYSSYGIVDVKGDPAGGKYVVIIEPVRQTIEVRAPGFKTEMIRLETLQPRDVMYYEVLPKKDEGISGVSDIAVTIQATPKDASIFVDGTPVKNDSPVKLSIGDHDLRVEKPGYSPHSQRITVSPDNTIFKVNLTTNDPVSVIINSTPSDAEIFIEGMSKGKTRKALFLYPRSYELRLVLSGYLSFSERITVTTDEKSNNFQYTLTKNTGKLKIEVSPAIATVRINKEVVNASEVQEFTPGTYQIEAEAATYYSYKGTVELRLGETKTERITLTQKAGKLQFAINPPEAECVLTQNGVEKYRWTGLKILSTISEGTYDLTAKAQGYKSYTGKVTIRENQTTVEDIRMTAGSDSIEGMVWVEGGTFTMGSSNGENDEEPTHQVTLNGFFIGKTEVTLETFSKFIQATGYRTDAEKGGDSYVLRGIGWEKKSGVDWRCDTKGNKRPDSGKLHPVIHVSWNDAVAYCNWLSEQKCLQKAYSGSGNSITCDFNANGYRLPTEAEWEYAARGGKKSKGHTFSGSNNLDEVGWYGVFSKNGNRTKDEGTSVVGKKLPNELGIHDMSGNVYEWCWDWYEKDYYSSSPGSNPKGPVVGSYRVLRGGSWYFIAMSCSVATRSSNPPDVRIYDRGFRVVRTK